MQSFSMLTFVAFNPLFKVELNNTWDITRESKTPYLISPASLHMVCHTGRIPSAWHLYVDGWNWWVLGVWNLAVLTMFCQEFNSGPDSSSALKNCFDNSLIFLFNSKNFKHFFHFLTFQNPFKALVLKQLISNIKCLLRNCATYWAFVVVID